MTKMTVNIATKHDRKINFVRYTVRVERLGINHFDAGPIECRLFDKLALLVIYSANECARRAILPFSYGDQECFAYTSKI